MNADPVHGRWNGEIDRRKFTKRNGDRIVVKISVPTLRNLFMAHDAIGKGECRVLEACNTCEVCSVDRGEAV